MEQICNYSISKLGSFWLIIIEDLSLLLYGESDLQTKQLQPITGTPRDDPHPKILTSNMYFTL